MQSDKEKEDGRTSWFLLSQFREEIYGIAIISIIIFHYFEDLINSKTGGVAGEIAFFYNNIFGSIGVEVFLLLSGMGLYFSMKKDHRILSFYKKRLNRLLIPYALCGLIFWGIRDLVILKGGVKLFLMDFFLITFWTEGTKTLWFIGLLIILYILFPVIYLCFSRKNCVRFITCLLLVFISAAFPVMLKEFDMQLFKKTEIAFFRIPIFIYGAYLGERIYMHRRINVPDIIFFIIGIACKLWNVLFAYKVLESACPIEKRLVNSMFAVALTVLLALMVQKVCTERVRCSLRKAGMCSLELFLTHVTIRKLMNLTKYPTRELFNYCFCIVFALFGTYLLRRFTKYVQGHKGVNKKIIQA